MFHTVPTRPLAIDACELDQILSSILEVWSISCTIWDYELISARESASAEANGYELWNRIFGTSSILVFRGVTTPSIPTHHSNVWVTCPGVATSYGIVVHYICATCLGLATRYKSRSGLLYV